MKDNWLDQLAPAHAPPPPGWWPLAPGWWALGVLLIAALAFFAWWWRSSPQRQRRAALLELKQIETSTLDDGALAHRLENLLRRYAVARFGREPVARLAGERWIAFIETRGGKALAGDAGHALLRAAYGGKAAQQHRALWLRGARGFLRGRA